MTDKNYTHLLLIVDRSGSMVGIAGDMIGGINTLFKEQAQVEGTCLVDYVMFDTEYEHVYQDRPVDKAEAVLKPRGGTALLDAVGKSVTVLGERFAAMDEDARPGLVQVVIVTDGYENASREWSAGAIKALIAQQEEDYGWDFVFLGANINAEAVGAQYGLASGKTMTYSTANVGETTAALSSYVTRSRNFGAESNAFTDEEKQEAVK